jgi:hypothetical protein
MEVFCNLLQIIKVLPFNPWLGHISHFYVYTYLPNLDLNSAFLKNTIKICNYIEEKTVPCTVQLKYLYLQLKVWIAYILAWNKYKKLFLQILLIQNEPFEKGHLLNNNINEKCIICVSLTKPRRKPATGMVFLRSPSSFFLDCDWWK